MSEWGGALLIMCAATELLEVSHAAHVCGMASRFARCWLLGLTVRESLADQSPMRQAPALRPSALRSLAVHDSVNGE